jgi:hypothetical protein
MIARMNTVDPPILLSVIAPLLALLQVMWYVAITVLLLKIWRKVKHLPG